MDDATEKKSKLIALHELQLYSQAWCQAIIHPKLTEAMSDLLGPNVEFEHTTLHAKPPETGHPFPMHQDWAFYQHNDGRYIDVLVHLDDTDDSNGCIRFLDRSHKLGDLEHITHTSEGPCTPQLPTEEYNLKDTIPVPAKKGDIVCFNIFTIHGSYINTTNNIRRLVRVGYRNPENKQISGRTLGRPGLMVKGKRNRINGQKELCAVQLTGHSGATN
jgi:ectoine hydroxylase-related dioxygenase (phytanoyl-CoA dioxygenase family)